MRLSLYIDQIISKILDVNCHFFGCHKMIYNFQVLHITVPVCKMQTSISFQSTHSFKSTQGGHSQITQDKQSDSYEQALLFQCVLSLNGQIPKTLQRLWFPLTIKSHVPQVAVCIGKGSACILFVQGFYLWICFCATKFLGLQTWQFQVRQSEVSLPGGGDFVLRSGERQVEYWFGFFVALF